MKAFLMFSDRDFDLGQGLPPNEHDLTADLELEKIFAAMALGDSFLLDLARRAVLSSLGDPMEIRYRQEILKDCMDHPSVVRELYAIAVEAIERERKVYHSFFHYPEAVLHRAIEVLRIFVVQLKRLRRIADEHGQLFSSAGFSRLFEMLRRELDDDYFRRVESHLDRLELRQGVLIRARLGRGNKAVDHTLLEPPAVRRGWRQWLPFGDRSAYTLVVADRDEGGMRALSEMKGRGIDVVANVLAQSADHILSFFSMLRAELGFYIGCLNLWEQLARKGEPICFPVPLAADGPILSSRGLYDVSLSLTVDERVVGNDLDADGKLLVMITGANQGGKSTFLRSVGQAQLMMQCGMFVAAESFRANVCEAIFTHFKREEDPTMTSGKLDEELSRMSWIADRVTSGSMVLFNESFSATNEREGSEIASSIVRALVESGIKVLFVTHLFELANRFHAEEVETALFLRVERQPDGRRTFRLLVGGPLPTSHGEDVYHRVFHEDAEVEPAVTPS